MGVGQDPLRRRSARGQATAEFALLVPVVVGLMLVVVQVVVLARVRLRLVDECRNVARVLIVRPGATGSDLLRSAGVDEPGLDVGAPGGLQPGRVGSVLCRRTEPTDVPIVGRLAGEVSMEERLAVLVEGPEGVFGPDGGR